MNEYKGISEEKAKEALSNLGKRMFDLFDKDEKAYRYGNRGLCLMGVLSWTASFVAREAIDEHLKNGDSLENSWIEALINDEYAKIDGYTKIDLLLLKK